MNFCRPVFFSFLFVAACGLAQPATQPTGGLDSLTDDRLIVEQPVHDILHRDAVAGVLANETDGAGNILILDGQFRGRLRPLVIAGPPGVRARVLQAMEVLFPGSAAQAGGAVADNDA